MAQPHTIVIGAGISGLACAWRLRRLGHAVTVLERQPRAGGVIDTLRSGAFQFEMGPQSFLSSDALLSLIRDLGLEGQLQRGDRRAARYILLSGKLVRAPLAPPTLLTTPLLSLGTKLRLFSEMFRRSQPPEKDESVADFVRRKFGADLLQNLVAPLVSGIYAGDPERLSLRAAFPFLHQWESQYGSVLKGARKSAPAKGQARHGLCSFQGGVTMLTEALRGALGGCVRTGVAAASIEQDTSASSSGFQVRTSSGDTLSAGTVVLATPADAAANLLRPHSPAAAEALAGIEYAPVGVVNTGYPRAAVRHPLAGFGFLVPRGEELHILGTVWSSSLFPGRAPQDCVALASFVGGATNPRVVNLPERELVEIVHRENAGVLGITARPVTTAVRVYSRALPQYNLGHGERLRRAAEALARLPRLHITGNYISGPSIAACVDQAFKVAECVSKEAQPPDG